MAMNFRELSGEMNQFKDLRKDWLGRLAIRRNNNGGLIVDPDNRGKQHIDRVGSVLFKAGYRYLRNVQDITGEPHFVLKKHHAAIFVCSCDSGNAGMEHDCAKLRETDADRLGAEQENSKRLDLVVAGVERLGFRVDVVFSCQIHDVKLLAERMRHFVSGKNSYSERDRLAWLRRHGEMVDFGLSEEVPERFLLPAVVMDRALVGRSQICLGRVGGSHADVFSTIPASKVQQVNTITFGYLDRSGAFLTKRNAFSYAARYSLIPAKQFDKFPDLNSDELSQRAFCDS